VYVLYLCVTSEVFTVHDGTVWSLSKKAAAGGAAAAASDHDGSFETQEVRFPTLADALKVRYDLDLPNVQHRGNHHTYVLGVQLDRHSEIQLQSQAQKGSKPVPRSTRCVVLTVCRQLLDGGVF